MESKIYKAGYVIIGDEILSGRTQDKNTVVLAQRLNERGVRLTEIRVVGDDEPMIIEAVREFSGRYDYVFTSGGIGPTHDDITALAIARAFERELYLEKTVFEQLKEFCEKNDNPLTEARKKMAFYPKGATLIKNEVSFVPGFSLNNVFVLAGVPAIFKTMLEATMAMIEGGEKLHSEVVTTRLGEGDLADILQRHQEQFADTAIGSYPMIDTLNEKGKALWGGVQVIVSCTDVEKARHVARLIQEEIQAKGE